MSEVLIALAERVEAATGADRQIDAAIFAAVYVDQDLIDQLPDASSDDEIDGGWAAIVVPAYTASLDAAMTLVPDTLDISGERFRLEHWNFNGVHAEHVRASAWVPGAARVYTATPALALTAAALRASAARTS